MRTENHIEFTEDLSERLGFFIWMHSAKCKRIRIGLFAALAASLVMAVVTLLRRLVIHTTIKWTVLYLFIAILIFAAMVVAVPLIYRKRIMSSIRPGMVQIVTMDEHFVNLHVGDLNARFRWNKFIDIDEDDDYYYLFTDENYVVLDKLAFPGDGHDIFLEMHTPARLLRESSRKSRLERYAMLFAGKDYLTALANTFGGKQTRK